MTDHARPPEGVETADVYRCRLCGVLTTSNIHCYAHCDPVDAVALLAKQEQLDRITARLTDLGVIASEGRDPDGERFDVADTVLALLDGEREARERAERERDEALLGKGRREAVIEALARSEGESENTLLRSALAVIFTALGGRLPTRTSEAAAFALERLEQLTDLAADRDAAVARAEQAEAERDELRKRLRDGNDEGTSTTAEAARDVGRESRNRK